MHSIRRIPLRSRPLPPAGYIRICRGFSSKQVLQASPAGQAAAARPESDNDASSSSPNQPQRASNQSPSAAQRKESADSLTAFINQMMPPRSGAKRGPMGSGGGEDSGEQSDMNPVARKQSEMLRNVTRGARFAENLVAQRGATKLPPLAPPVRLDAYISRAESVEGGTTLARAIDKLNIKLAVNKVRHDIRRQKFHERPGLKRKRLKRERWRRRFKDGFAATVRKVRRMRAQGW